jgi:hypothetical protein
MNEFFLKTKFKIGFSILFVWNKTKVHYEEMLLELVVN